MSDKPEGPGWWIASDGNWYPPELHPSVTEGSRMQSPVDTPVRPAGQVPEHVPMVAGAEAHPSRWQGGPDRDAHVGPTFPDLYQKAMEGSHLADNITVHSGGLDDEVATGSFTSTRPGGGSRGGAPVGASSGGSTKRRWRKGR
jgi:hypothetical protein